MPAPTYQELQATITVMFALLLLVSCLALTKPETPQRAQDPRGILQAPLAAHVRMSGSARRAKGVGRLGYSTYCSDDCIEERGHAGEHTFRANPVRTDCWCEGVGCGWCVLGLTLHGTVEHTEDDPTVEHEPVTLPS